MSKPQALVVRLYFDPKLYELARLVGYQGVAIEGEFRKRLDELVAQYGRIPMQQAADEIVTVDTVKSPPFARLRPEVVPFMWQLLGPPPEQEAAFYRNADGSANRPDWKPQPNGEEPQPEPKKRRKKK